MQRVVGRMRPSIHPDCSLRTPREMMGMNRNELLRCRIPFFPNPHAPETRYVIRRMHPALILRQCDERGIPTVCPQPRCVGERNTCVVAKFRPEQPVQPVFMNNAGTEHLVEGIACPEVIPHSGETH